VSYVNLFVSLNNACQLEIYSLVYALREYPDFIEQC